MNSCMDTGMKVGMNQQQLRGLSRIGDLMLPGDHLSPAFSALDVTNQVDRVLAEAEPADVRDLAQLLGLLDQLPDWMLKALLWLAEHADRFPDLIGSPLRLLNLGLKGLIVTLYYGAEPGLLARAQSPLKAIDYQVHCKPDQAQPSHPCRTHPHPPTTHGETA